MTRFNGRRALVTGGASGIGAATVALLRAEGAEVVAVDLHPTDDVRAGDVTDAASVTAFVGEAVAELGGLDLLVNVAGIVHFARIEDLTLADWDRHLAVNLTGPLLVSQAAVPHLVASRGNIVTVASVAGLKGQAYTAAYSASKGGVVMLMKSLALELADRGVRVNSVCPGGVNTPLIGPAAASIPADADPKLMDRLQSVIPDLVRADEVAEAVAYLASDAARMINGTTLVIDGGTLS
jgi:meso-butanediol dehydrogenase / (S,S)-butanediol dehydrogenase / diacetyl reductase